MHLKEYKGILSADNGMNLSRGCLHGCIYCDARSKCYNMQHPFEDVEIKINAPQLLEDALRRKRKKCMIGTGAMSDPYMPVPESLAITRQCLEIIARHGFGIAIQTKSNRMLHDIDILKTINKKAKCIAITTLTTADEKLCSLLEPNVSGTYQRFEMLKTFRDNGIETVVWITPILPFINDTQENIQKLLDYCVEAKVYGIFSFGMGLTLREGDREYYYQNLDKHFPGLKQKYQTKYGNKYILTSDNNKRLMDLFYTVCGKHHIVCNNDALFKHLHEFPAAKTRDQMELFD